MYEVNIAKLLGHAKQSDIDVFQTVSKREIQKTADATGNLIDNKASDKITQIHNKIIQRQSHMRIKKKYLKKDTYLQKEDKYLLMNWDWNSIIMEYQKIINFDW